MNMGSASPCSPGTRAVPALLSSVLLALSGTNTDSKKSCGVTPDVCPNSQGRCTFLSGHGKGVGTCHVLHQG